METCQMPLYDPNGTRWAISGRLGVADESAAVGGDGEDVVGGGRESGDDCGDETLGVGAVLGARHGAHVVRDRPGVADTELGREVVPGHPGEKGSGEGLAVVEGQPLAAAQAT